MTGATLPPSAQLLGVFSRPVLCSHIGEKKKKKGKKKGGGERKRKRSTQELLEYLGPIPSAMTHHNIPIHALNSPLIRVLYSTFRDEDFTCPDRDLANLAAKSSAAVAWQVNLQFCLGTGHEASLPAGPWSVALACHFTYQEVIAASHPFLQS